MNVRTYATRGILTNITNMEEDEKKVEGPTTVNYEKNVNNDKGDEMETTITGEIREQPTAALVDAQLRAMAVSGSTTVTRKNDNAYARSAGKHTESDSPRAVKEDKKDHSKPFVKTRAKFNLSGGSGSGDHDGMISMEDGNDIAAKKRKTRRGKPKHRKGKPYSKQQYYQQRLRCRATGRPSKTGRQIPAPYNTTQFLMEDHNDLPDLDQKIDDSTNNVLPTAFSKPVAPPRTRDSSFSVDSEEDYFYSSPEDEEEFLTKEFSTAYEDLHAERLGALSKSELIQEYIQLEAKVDSLTKRLRNRNASQQEDRESGIKSMDGESIKKVKIYQQRIDELIQQNEQLRRDNELLKQRHGSPMSSIDSESDSDSSSNATDCSCNHKSNSTGSSPVPASYHECREKSNRRQNCSVSSINSSTDSVGENKVNGIW